MIATERVQRLLQPGYASELGGRSTEDLRAMHEESAQAENALSYYRRLAQARMEILEAERARRERGGSVEDLVADLPRILSAESGRSSITNTRGAPATDPPSIELHWPDGREQLVIDNTLAKLPGHSADERDTRPAPALRARALRPAHADPQGDGRHRRGDRRAPRRRDRGMKTESLDSLEVRLHELGGFIRDQRRNARLSLRKLSELAGISNPYLSQIERGLRKPSAEILQGIARGLRISAETLYVRAGILDERDDAPDLVAAVTSDPTLTERQKQVLLEIYRSFQQGDREETA